MVDKNGVEMKTGDIVRVSGAYFKNDNGLWFIERSPGDPSWCGNSYSLMKLKRNGQPSTAKYNLCSWPIAIFTNSWATRNEAHRWNEEHAEIEVVTGMDTSALAEHFMGLAKELDPYIERGGLGLGRKSPGRPAPQRSPQVLGIRGGAAQEITHLTMAAWQQPKPFCRGRQDGRGSQPQKGRF